MHPNYTEFLKFLLERKRYQYDNKVCFECGKMKDDVSNIESKQNIGEYSIEEILSDFFDNF